MRDLISRLALKNALTDWQMEYAEKGKDVERFETLGAVIDLVEQLPTIEPKDWNGWENGCGRTYDFEPKRGKWKKLTYRDDSKGFKCSVCGGVSIIPTSYCGNCGAKMER